MAGKKVWMNGHGCLKCVIGWYDGYIKELTKPCNKCGHQAPAVMSVTDFRKIIKERDENNKKE